MNNVSRVHDKVQVIANRMQSEIEGYKKAYPSSLISLQNQTGVARKSVELAKSFGSVDVTYQGNIEPTYGLLNRVCKAVGGASESSDMQTVGFINMTAIPLVNSIVGSLCIIRNVTSTANLINFDVMVNQNGKQIMSQLNRFTDIDLTDTDSGELTQSNPIEQVIVSSAGMPVVDFARAIVPGTFKIYKDSTKDVVLLQSTGTGELIYDSALGTFGTNKEYVEAVKTGKFETDFAMGKFSFGSLPFVSGWVVEARTSESINIESRASMRSIQRKIDVRPIMIALDDNSLTNSIASAMYNDNAYLNFLNLTTGLINKDLSRRAVKYFYIKAPLSADPTLNVYDLNSSTDTGLKYDKIREFIGEKQSEIAIKNGYRSNIIIASPKVVNQLRSDSSFQPVDLLAGQTFDENIVGVYQGHTVIESRVLQDIDIADTTNNPGNKFGTLILAYVAPDGSYAPVCYANMVPYTITPEARDIRNPTISSRALYGVDGFGEVDFNLMLKCRFQFKQN